MKVFKYIILFLYYFLPNNLPKSTFPVIGPFCRNLRALFVKGIFKKTGKNVTIENRCYFGKGFDIEIGDNSGIGKNCRIPSNVVIGNNVMMAEEIIIFSMSHNFERTDITMNKQGAGEKGHLHIGNDIWIGTRAIILPKVKRIGDGSVIGAGSVVTKDIPDYVIVGGNPARIIKSRR